MYLNVGNVKIIHKNLGNLRTNIWLGKLVVGK
jgi:hypothetical protein